jgi:hypothetical protein
MADKVNAMTSIIRPTQLGKSKPDLKLSVAKVGARLFRVEDGEVKVPRKRRGTDDSEYAWFEELEAPKTMYVFLADPGKPEDAIEVEWNEDIQLFEAKEPNEDGSRDQYTGDNVMEVGLPDARQIEGTPEAINKLQAAVSRFNNRTGKRLVVRFVKDERDKSGRTLVATREVYRTR